MNITASQVNELRQKSGAGMMDCKKALVEAEGEMEKAFEILRKKGAAVAAKRADRSANEGIILTKVSDDKKKASIIEVNCETDFVAKSDDFVALADMILAKVFETGSGSTEVLFESNPEVKDKISEVTGKVGEKTEISRVKTVTVENGMIADYIHPGSKLAVLVLVENLPTEKISSFQILAKDFAMQVAAMKPVSTYREEVPVDVVEKEIEIYKEIARKEGKPENILQKIAEGKLNKFYSENCLFEQAYVKDNSKTIKDLVNEFNKNNGTTVKIQTFLRYQLSDEKK